MTDLIWLLLSRSLLHSSVLSIFLDELWTACIPWFELLSLVGLRKTIFWFKVSIWLTGSRSVNCWIRQCKIDKMNYKPSFSFSLKAFNSVSVMFASSGITNTGCSSSRSVTSLVWAFSSADFCTKKQLKSAHYQLELRRYSFTHTFDSIDPESWFWYPIWAFIFFRNDGSSGLENSMFRFRWAMAINFNTTTNSNFLKWVVEKS